MGLCGTLRKLHNLSAFISPSEPTHTRKKESLLKMLYTCRLVLLLYRMIQGQKQKYFKYKIVLIFNDQKY